MEKNCSKHHEYARINFADRTGASLWWGDVCDGRCGEYKTVKDASQAIVKVKETVYPKTEIMQKNEAENQIFKSLYPALKNVFRQF